MKARTRNAPWLLIALLCGFLAIAGVTLLHRHGSTPVAQSISAAPTPARLQQPDTSLVASIGEKHTLPAAAPLYDRPATAKHSYSQQRHATSHSGTAENASGGSASSDRAADPATGSSETITPQDNRPSPAATSHAPQQLGNSFAYNGYAPLDCELPAGCGVSGGMDYVSHQPSGTSGGQPIAHDSQGSSPPGSGSAPQANNDSDPKAGNTGGSGTPGDSNPTGSGSNPVAAAPELDPATLADAVTLLLGSLVVLRSRRRARATR